MVSKRKIEHKFVCKGREKNSQEATNNQHYFSRKNSFNNNITNNNKSTTSRGYSTARVPSNAYAERTYISRGEEKTRLDIKLWDINMTGKRQHQIAGPKSKSGPSAKSSVLF